MRRGIAGLALTLVLCVPVGGRLLQQKKVSAASSLHAGTAAASLHIEEPFTHPLEGLPLPVVEATSACPRECACHTGDGANGGTNLVSGMCLDYCSQEYYGARHCGTGADYTAGNFLDCRACVDPQYFGAITQVYKPEGTPERSMIILGPWNGTQGWMFNWTIKYSEEMDPTIRQKYRVIDVAPKPWPGTDYSAWYGYANQDDWFTDTPIQREVDLAVAYVHSLIEQEYQVVGDYKRIILAGLSQGASLALESAVRFPHALGLVLSQRGIVSKERRQSTAPIAGKQSYIMFMGEEDSYYGVTPAKKSCRYLQNAGNQVFLKTIPGLDHDSDEGEPRVREWRLTVRALAAVVSQDPSLAAQAVTKVADWTACA